MHYSKINSRIRRRLKCNPTPGIGKHSDFNAHHSFGSYLDTPDRIIASKKQGTYLSLVTQCINRSSLRHPGSKTIRQMIKSL